MNLVIVRKTVFLLLVSFGLSNFPIAGMQGSFGGVSGDFNGQEVQTVAQPPENQSEKQLIVRDAGPKHILRKIIVLVIAVTMCIFLHAIKPIKSMSGVDSAIPEDALAKHPLVFALNSDMGSHRICEIVSDGSRFCHKFQGNYVVESCVNPSLENLPVYCMRYDFTGIYDRTGNLHGDKPQENHLSIGDISAEDSFGDYNITFEFFDLLKSPEMLAGYQNGETRGFLNKIMTKPRVNPFLRCKVIAIDNQLPRFITKIRELAKKFSVPIPPITILLNSACTGYDSAKIKYSQSGAVLTIPRWFFDALLLPDTEVAGVMAHELKHLYDVIYKEMSLYINLNLRTGNNEEFEADMASVLVANNLGEAKFLLKACGWKELGKDFAIQIPRLEEVRKIQDHPGCATIRLAVMAYFYNNYKKVREILLGTK